MTHDQAVIAVPLLNSYAHQYLGLGQSDVMVTAGRREGVWLLIVATDAGVAEATDFDAAKAVIDTMFDVVMPSSVSAPEKTDG